MSGCACRAFLALLYPNVVFDAIFYIVNSLILSLKLGTRISDTFEEASGSRFPALPIREAGRLLTRGASMRFGLKTGRDCCRAVAASPSHSGAIPMVCCVALGNSESVFNALLPVDLPLSDVGASLILLIPSCWSVML